MREIYECPLGMKCEQTEEISGETVKRLCHWYIHVLGMDPQTGQELDKWLCAIAAGPLLQIENSNMLRGVQESVESLRNEGLSSGAMVATGLQRISEAVQQRRLLGDIDD